MAMIGPAKPFRRTLFSAVLFLISGLAVAVLLALLTMSINLEDLLLLVGYLAATGAASMALGWFAVGRAEADTKLTLRRKAFLISLVGSLTGLLSVLLVSQLMFVSTSHDLRVLAATLGFNVFVMAGFGALIASSVSNRVDFVTEAIRSLSAGNYDEPIDETGTDEIARLAGNVNRLAQQLKAAEEAQQLLETERRELTAAVSHDLRTPLASIRAMVEALSDGIVSDDAEARRYYVVMQREVERLNRMVDDLFDLSQIDNGVLALQVQLLPLEEIAAEVVEAMQAQARSQHVELALQVDGPLPKSMIDGHRIERVIANLLRNALEHTPAKGRIEVRLHQDDDWIALSVADNGQGIEEDQLARIWQRFYRADVSRARTGKASGDGAGLGLAIVRGFVEAHGGHVAAESQARRGSVFSFRLPVVYANTAS